MNANSNPTAKALPSTDDLGQQIEALRAELVKLAATLTDDMSGGIGRAERQIAATAREARATATDTVLDHPLAAVGIAAGIGLLLGMILRKG
jgi:ElaB/YqjD/DUF883 family membrane-anchored ribosome-binding protein